MPNIDYKGAGKPRPSKPGKSDTKAGCLPSGSKDAQLAHDISDMSRGRNYPYKRGPEWMRARRDDEVNRRMTY